MPKKSEITEPKPDLRSWCNPLPPTWPESMQRERLTGELYMPDRKRDARAELIRSVRDGSIVEVCDTFLLAQTIGRVDVRRRDLIRVMDEIEDRGGIIRELSSGLETPKGRRRMRERAFEAITNHARGRRSAVNGALSTGAPRTWPREGQIFDGYRNIWQSRRYRNDNERRTATEKNFGDCPSRGWLRNTFGSPHDTRDQPPPTVKPPKRHRKRGSFVYFIQDGNKIKIGFSTRPEVRARNLQTHSPLKILVTIPGDRVREAKLHKRFHKIRVDGTREWFHAKPPLLKYIAGLQQHNKT
jgi:hypothetical protein